MFRKDKRKNQNIKQFNKQLKERPAILVRTL